MPELYSKVFSFGGGVTTGSLEFLWWQGVFTFNGEIGALLR